MEELGNSVERVEKMATRRTLTQPKFDELYQRGSGDITNSLRGKMYLFRKKSGRKLRQLYCGDLKNYRNNKPPCCSLLYHFIYRFFPFIGIMRHYDVKKWLINDIVAGFTVGVMHVPQGMAYAMLATLPAVYGLYSSIFAPFFYFFLGTSRHLSMGTIAIISLLVGGCLDRNVPSRSNSAEVGATSLVQGNATSVVEDEEVTNRVMLAIALAITVGLIQLSMSLLRLGFLTQFLSQPVISGFTVGSAVHVALSQVSTSFGISIDKSTGVFNIPKNFYQFCASLPKVNWATTGLSVACIVVLLVFKLCINPPIVRKIRVPVPIELLIIVFGGVVSHFLRLATNYGVKVVGKIPLGLPRPLVPEIWRAGAVLGDAFVIALISFSISFSLASFYGRKEGYSVDPNQELMAYGITNILGSFFRTYPLAGSLSRTALQASIGGKTQVVGLLSSGVLVLVVLFAGPLFNDVPNCCLSAIILVALRSMFAKISELPRLWRHSIWDFASWVITFLATVFLDVIYGLIIGIAFSAMSVVIRAQRPQIHVLGRFDQSEVFKPTKYYPNCLEHPSIKVIRYEGSLFYAGAERFISAVIASSGFDPRPVAYLRKIYEAAIRAADVILNPATVENELEIEPPTNSHGDASQPHPNSLIDTVDSSKSGKKGDSEEDSEANPRRRNRCCPCRRASLTSLSEAVDQKRIALCNLAELGNSVPFTHLILDCSAWNFMDLDGVTSLKSLMSDYRDANVDVYLASPSRTVYESMKRSGLFAIFEPSTVFISLSDAFSFAEDSVRIHSQRNNGKDDHLDTNPIDSDGI